MGSLLLYRGLTGVGGPVIEYLLRRRMACGKEDGQRLAERRGAASIERPEGPLVWLHAASVGEAQSSLALIRRILAARGDTHVLLTTGTVTSARLMADRLPPRSFHQFAPIDRVPWVRRFLDHWQPSLALWMESELWPNLVTETRRRGIPAALVNARMSPRTFARWRRLPGAARQLLGGFSICLAQTEEQAGMLRELGATHATYLGNLKFSAEKLPVDTGELERLRTAIGERPVWLAASTHAGEEVMAGEAHRLMAAAGRTDILTVVVPRHPTRGDDIETALAGAGLATNRRSTGRPIAPSDQVYLVDTMGELGLFYRLSEIAYIGGSMAHHGGHNPLEAAQLGCAVLHGPDMGNFKAIARDLATAGGAVSIDGADGLAKTIGRLLDDPAGRRDIAAAAARVAEENAGAIERIYEKLAVYIDGVEGDAGT